VSPQLTSKWPETMIKLHLKKTIPITRKTDIFLEQKLYFIKAFFLLITI